MKNKTLKIILIFVMVVLMVTALSACDFFDGVVDGFKDSLSGNPSTPQQQPTPQVTAVEAIHKAGLTVGENGVFVAVVGEEFTLDATLNTGAPDNVEYKWYMAVDGQKTEVGDSKALEYAFESYTDKTYEFSVTANGVASSNTILVTMEYSEKLIGTGISSTSHTIHDGVLQQYIDEISEIKLVADWDREALPEDAEVVVGWTIGDNPSVVSEEEQFSYTPSAVGTYEIHLTLEYNEDVMKHTLRILVIENYASVESAILSLDDGATAFGSGVETQYFQEVNSENRDEITITLNTTPVGETDYTSPVKWIVRDRSGERVLDDTGRSVTFEPAYGETIVKAVIDNVESKNIVVFAFTSADKTKYESYMKDTYVWVDGVENAYITDQTDIDRLVQYAFSTRQVFDGTKSSGFPFALASTFDFIQEGNDQPLIDTLQKIDESGKISINRSWTENTGTGEKYDYVLYVTEESRFMAPTANYSPAEKVTQDETAMTSLKKLEAGEKRTALPIDDNPEYPDAIKNSQMLYRVIGWGYKPTFDSSTESQKMQALYASIRQVALDYMTDEMSEYEKTLIIYEWIAQKVDYDYAIIDAPLGEYDSLCYNAFSLEGVFCDADGEGYGQAVCDGRAKAFVALCGVEDIKAIRVAGNSQIDGVQERHAWNKVLIDINGDGKKEWFMCDTTWSDRSSESDRTERLNKQYFLVTDEYIKNSHVADAHYFNPPCVTTFDYYANTIIDNGNEDFDLFIDKRNLFGGSDELERAVKYAKENGVMLEIKISTTVCDTSSELNYLITMKYAFGADIDIYTIAESSKYNIYTIVFN